MVHWFGQFSCRPLFMYGRFCADHGLALAWPLFPPTTFHIASLHMNIAYLSHRVTKWCSTIMCTPPKCLRWMVNLAKFILIIMRFIRSLTILCKQPRSCSIDLAGDNYSTNQISKILTMETLTRIKPAGSGLALIDLCQNVFYLPESKSYVHYKSFGLIMQLCRWYGELCW